MVEETSATCTACSRAFPKTLYGNAPAGWVLFPDSFGYYDGFSDCLLGDEDELEWWLCHDCIVKFFKTFPKLAEAYSRGFGHHPCEDDVPCCRFAWKATEDFGKYNGKPAIMRVGPDGTWVPVLD